MPLNLDDLLRGHDYRCLHSQIRIGGADYWAVVFTSSARLHVTEPLDNEVENPTPILLNVATALEFLHSVDGTHAIVHGNLNIDAISRIDGHIVLSGFDHCGIDPVLPAPTNGKQVAPPGHLPSIAPELVTRDIRTTQTDVYAFGMLMFRMFAGQYPFAEQRSSSRYIPAAPVYLISGKRPPREAIQHQHFTDELWKLMTECWEGEPSARPTMASVRARLAQMV